MIYKWSEATDKLDHYVRVALLDFSKAFDFIKHNTLLVKLKQYDLPPHIRRWIATFLTNTVGTGLLTVISVKTTFYICKNVITNEIYTLYVSRCVPRCVAFYCLVFYMLVCTVYVNPTLGVG